MPGLTCMSGGLPPYARAEVGGRRCRQPGQVRKEAATTISCRVVGFHPVITDCSAGSENETRFHPSGLKSGFDNVGIDPYIGLVTDSEQQPEDKAPSAAEMEAA